MSKIPEGIHYNTPPANEFINGEMQTLELIIDRACYEFTVKTGIVVKSIKFAPNQGSEYNSLINYRRFK